MLRIASNAYNEYNNKQKQHDQANGKKPPKEKLGNDALIK